MECRILKSGRCNITQEYNGNHQAIDLVGEGNSLDYITAHSDGKIVFYQDGYGNMKGSTGNRSYGNCIKIDHGNGYQTLYAHMEMGLLVKDKETIKKGQVLGYMGDSGNAYGKHLHFEVFKNGVRVDSTPFLNTSFDNNKGNIYIVESGDTLSAIAQKYGTTYQKIAEYNHIANPDLIYIGQKIIIPNTKSDNAAEFYTVKSGDNLSLIASKYNTTWQKIYNDNRDAIGDNPNLIYPNQKIIIKK